MAAQARSYMYSYVSVPQRTATRFGTHTRRKFTDHQRSGLSCDSPMTSSSIFFSQSDRRRPKF